MTAAGGVRVQGAASQGDCRAASRLSVPPPGGAYTHNMLHKVCVGVVVGVGGCGCGWVWAGFSHTTTLTHDTSAQTHETNRNSLTHTHAAALILLHQLAIGVHVN
jgi:hypothetical protein